MATLRWCAVALAAVAAAGGLAGCTGKIGGGTTTGAGAGPGPGGGGNVGAGTAGSVGGGGSTGSTGPTGVGGSGVVTSPPGNAGVVIVRRLNHSEYNNTVRDLLQTTLRPADSFPADDLGGEFDTVGSALSLSPAYVMAYEAAAHALVKDLHADATRRGRIVTCNVDTAGDTCAQTVLGAFARKAWRRPVTADETQTLMKPVTTARMVGATPTEGLQHALAAVLLSPHFIFKVEIDPDPTATTSRRVSPHELATRMSYALWSSTPDDALLAAADGGALATDEEIAAQIERLLADSRADALLDEFAAEWLDYKHVEQHEADARLFPRYTPALARSMRLEARRFVQEFLRSDLPVPEMLSARFTFLDSALATHYGLTRPAGGAATDFTRVDTSSAPRAGLLTLGAFLTATSLPTRTSPVIRGNFIFTRLLCGVINQPPPDVPPLPEDTTFGTLRERLEAHRSKPECMACHQVMDPLGFGLENFDAVGAYRTMDGTAPVNATGTLPDGKTSFDGAAELSAALSKDPSFTACVTRKFMTFAVGRLLNQRDDAAWVSYLSGRAVTAGGSLKAIIRTVMLSDGFRSRQAVPPP
jgi:hypothetical protein